MKRRNFILGLAGVFSLSACNSIIDIEPEFVKDGSQIFTTIEDYEYALTGAYSLFREVGYFASGAQTTSTWASLPDMMGDNLVRTTEDLANWQEQVNWVYESTDSDINTAWQEAYSVVAQANLVLRNIDQFSATNPKAVNRIKGQALAIRAVAHFDVLRYWGTDYDLNSTGLGIPYVEIVDINNKPSRLTVAESWAKIFADMTQAETLLGNVDGTINSGNSRSYLDQKAVRALLARMYLYAGQYEEAEAFASQVIAEEPLATGADFEGIWTDASTAEVLWAVPFNAGEGSPSSGVHNAPSNRNRFRPADPLLALYDQNNDIRYGTYFGVRSLSGAPRNILRKFYGRGNASDNLVNWKVIRTGELYLIRAEARARQGGAKEALANTDLNDLRSARIADYAPETLTGSALIEAIFTERKKELVGEGHQWFDIKRTTRTIERTDPGLLAGSGVILTPEHRAWVWPVPQSEIDANENIRGQQSAGY